MRVQRAHKSRGINFPTFFGPPIWVGVGPRRALQFCSSSWFGQAKKAVAEKKAGQEAAEKVPSSPHWMDAVSVALRATRAHALSGNIRLIRTVRCVGPPRVRVRVGARNGGAMGATACASALL